MSTIRPNGIRCKTPDQFDLRRCISARKAEPADEARRDRRRGLGPPEAELLRGGKSAEQEAGRDGVEEKVDLTPIAPGRTRDLDPLPLLLKL